MFLFINLFGRGNNKKIYSDIKRLEGYSFGLISFTLDLRKNVTLKESLSYVMGVS